MMELIPKESIQALCAHRARALELYRQAAELLVAANKAAVRATGDTRTGWVGLSSHDFDHLTYSRASADEFAGAMRKKLDSSMWSYLIDRSKIGDVMDATARKQFREGLEKNPPPADEDNIAATLSTLIADAGNILTRGMVKLFEDLHPRFKRHDAFRIGPRMAINNAFHIWTWNEGGSVRTNISRGHGYRDEQIIDLERMLYVLDGKAPPDHGENIMAKVSPHLRNGPGQFATPYLVIRWFKNGNAHLTITRPDLVARVNAILAERGGLPDGRAAA